MRVFADGVPQPGSSFDCDFTRVVPCSQATDAPLSLDTRALADGVHSVQAAASDPAGNEARSAGRSITVDNTAPAAPAAVSTSGGATSSFDVTWSNPSGQVSPIVAVRYRICSATGTACGGEQRVAGYGISELSSVAVPGSGDWQLRLWLEDAAGNSDPSRSTSTLLRYGSAASDGAGAGSGDSATGSGGATTGDATGPGPAQVPSLSVDGSLGALVPGSPGTAVGSTTPARRSARLRLTSARLDRRRLTLRGRIATGAAGRAVVRFRTRHGLIRRVRRLDGGRFRLAVRTHHRPARVALRYAGNAKFLAASVGARVTRRR